MNVFGKIVAGLGAVVFTATAVGLPDIGGYCTLRAMSAAVEARHVVAGGHQPLQGVRATQVSLRGVCNEHRRLPI